MTKRFTGAVVLCAAAGVLAAGCSRSSPTAVTAGSGLVLRVNQPASPPSGAPVVNLIRVDNDSRCPLDVTCVWSGNAEVVVTVSTGPTPAIYTLAQQFLNTNIEPRSVVVNGYRIVLDSLLPRPVSTHTIQPGEYVAYVSVFPMYDGR